MLPACVIAGKLTGSLQPIRTPGAVQGFGVLIAVEEDFETGNLVVRQVSEVRYVPNRTLFAPVTASDSVICAELDGAAWPLAVVSIRS